MKTIPLSRGKFALVDDCDFERVSQFKWHCCKNKNGDFIPVRNVRISPGPHGRVTQYLSRFVIGASGREQVDHRNHDTLNQTRENLRIATPSQNGANRRAFKNNRCGTKGVRIISSGRWSARIRVNGILSHIGTYDTKNAASEAYKAAAVKHFGEFAFR